MRFRIPAAESIADTKGVHSHCLCLVSVGSRTMK